MSDSSFLMQDNVKKSTKKPLYPRNDILKRLIYIQHKSNINRFALEIGISRQYIFAIISGYMRPSPALAMKISEVLGFDTRVIFPDGSIEYPEIKTAFAELKGERVSGTPTDDQEKIQEMKDDKRAD